MISLYIKAISIIAPGINNWDEAQAVFSQKKPYSSAKVAKKLSTMLPPNESRRCSRTTQLALSSVQQLTEQVSFDSQNIRYVFSSCNGDLTVFHHISSALAQEGRPVSPIKFHNSVHNAPAGYASIVLQSNAPSTSITAYKDSIANALLEAAVQSTISQQPCLLTAYDEVPPEPLHSLFPIADDFSCSLLLVPKKNLDPVSNKNYKEEMLCRLDISITHKQKISIMEQESLEFLRCSNPQAKILPLLSAIAIKKKGTLYFNDNQQQIACKLSEFSGEAFE